MPKRLDYSRVIETLQVLPCLAAYTPVVIGTPPLGLAIAGSDIDIACCAPDLERFGADLVRGFGSLPRFEMRRSLVRSVPSLVCSFDFMHWTIEIFGQPVPVAAQYGVRHFAIERRVLGLLGAGFRARVLALKTAGLKTEPAFAQLLGLAGDPYKALLDLETWPDERVLSKIDLFEPQIAAETLARLAGEGGER